MTDDEMSELIKLVRKTTVEEMAKQLCDVQPMPSFTPEQWKALGESELWQSFCNRHFRRNKDD